MPGLEELTASKAVLFTVYFQFLILDITSLHGLLILVINLYLSFGTSSLKEMSLRLSYAEFIGEKHYTI